MDLNTDLKQSSSHNKSKNLPSVAFFISPTQEDVKYQEKLTEFQHVYEAVWKPLEEPILSSFESITGNSWKPNLIEHGIRVTLTATRRSQWWGRTNGEMDLNCKELDLPYEWKSTYRIMESQFHELAHAIQTKEDKTFVHDTLEKRLNPGILKGFLPEIEDEKARKNRFSKEVYAELISFAAAKDYMSPEQYAKWQERKRKSYNGSVYKCIDILTEGEKRAIINKKYREERAERLDETQEKKGFPKLQNTVRRFFIRKK